MVVHLGTLMLGHTSYVPDNVRHCDQLVMDLARNTRWDPPKPY